MPRQKTEKPPDDKVAAALEDASVSDDTLAPPGDRNDANVDPPDGNVDAEADRDVAPIAGDVVVEATEYPLRPKDRETDIILILMASFRDNDCHR